MLSDGQRGEEERGEVAVVHPALEEVGECSAETSPRRAQACPTARGPEYEWEHWDAGLLQQWADRAVIA